MVSITTIVFMGIIVVFLIALAVALPIIIKKKWHTAVSPYFIGWAVFTVFALILESIMHYFVLGATGNTITGNMWLYALYGGFAAGIFEETGRFLAMKFVMKKHHSNAHNALMYGAGHGCFEAVALVGMSMVVNIVFSLMINAGQLDIILASIPPEQQEAMQSSLSQLTDWPSYMFLLSGFERITAIMLHISFSILVWTAVVKRKALFYPLAILLHAFVDGLLVILQQNDVNYFIIEMILFLISLAIAFFTYLIWTRELVNKPTDNI